MSTLTNAITARARANADKYKISTFHADDIFDLAAYVDVTQKDIGAGVTVRVHPSSFGVSITVYLEDDPTVVVDTMMVPWVKITAAGER